MSDVKQIHQSVSQAAAGSQRDLLVALRNKIAGIIDDDDAAGEGGGLYPRDLYALSNQLMKIRQQIDDLDKQADVNDVGAAVDVPDERWNAS